MQRRSRASSPIRRHLIVHLPRKCPAAQTMIAVVAIIFMCPLAVDLHTSFPGRR